MVTKCEFTKAEGSATQNEIAKGIVGIDQTIMFIMLIGLSVLTYIVMIDSENHRNKLFETYEFSVVITRLPQETEDFNQDTLKIDLWNHIMKINKDQPQQIDCLSEGDRSCEIFDI